MLGLGKSLGVVALALSSTATLADEASAPTLPLRSLPAALQIVDAYNYKPFDDAAVTARIAATSRLQAKDGAERFDRFFGELTGKSKLSSALMRSVDAAVNCLKLDRADAVTQDRVSTALFEAIAAVAGGEMQLLPSELLRESESDPARSPQFAAHRVGDLLVIDLRSMAGGETDLLKQAWIDHGKGARALVVDLRNNGGGTLDEALALADSLLEKGTIATIAGRSPADRQVFTALPGAIAPNVPIAVLIGPRTAAGAEIFAGALRGNGRAVLVGASSFGRGSIETVFIVQPRLPLRLSTAQALLPDGSGFQGKGLTPDCVTALDSDAELELAGHIAIGGLKECPRS